MLLESGSEVDPYLGMSSNKFKTISVLCTIQGIDELLESSYAKSDFALICNHPRVMFRKADLEAGVSE